MHEENNGLQSSGTGRLAAFFLWTNTVVLELVCMMMGKANLKQLSSKFLRRVLHCRGDACYANRAHPWGELGALSWERKTGTGCVASRSAFPAAVLPFRILELTMDIVSGTSVVLRATEGTCPREVHLWDQGRAGERRSVSCTMLFPFWMVPAVGSLSGARFQGSPDLHIPHPTHPTSFPSCDPRLYRLNIPKGPNQ